MPNIQPSLSSVSTWRCSFNRNQLSSQERCICIGFQDYTTAHLHVCGRDYSFIPIPIFPWIFWVGFLFGLGGGFFKLIFVTFVLLQPSFFQTALLCEGTWWVGSALSPTKSVTVFNWSGVSNGNYYLKRETSPLECFMSFASKLKEEMFLVWVLLGVFCLCWGLFVFLVFVCCFFLNRLCHVAIESGSFPATAIKEKP